MIGKSEFFLSLTIICPLIFMQTKLGHFPINEGLTISLVYYNLSSLSFALFTACNAQKINLDIRRGFGETRSRAGDSRWMARHRDLRPRADMPNQDTGPRLVIDPVPGSTHFRWRLEDGGKTLATGVELHPDGFSATDGAAKSALMILHTLSSSYTRLCRQIRDAPQPGEVAETSAEVPEVLTCAEGSLITDEEVEAPPDAEVKATDPNTVAYMLGKTMRSVEQSEDEILFKATTGEVFRMYHGQDCCEHVEIEDIAGDLGDLVGSPLTMSEEISSEPPDGHVPNEESETWTFYKFATVKGFVTIRWYGSSNGYYSESVDFMRIEDGSSAETEVSEQSGLEATP